MSHQRSPALEVVNPKDSAIYDRNVVLTGTTFRYHARYQGSLSVKTVLAGEGAWTCESRRFVVRPGTWLLLNAGQEYSLSIESHNASKTFCLFFRASFVEDVARNFTATDSQLLDDPYNIPSAQFRVGLRPRGTEVSELLSRMYSRFNCNRKLDWDRWFYGVARHLVLENKREAYGVQNITAGRPSTRAELARRLSLGIDFMLSNLDQPLTLTEIARQSHLSDYHFHRVFSAAYRCTPHQFLVQQRLLHAEELLKHSCLPVTDICFSCGFQSLGSFSTLFATRHSGVPPIKYRLKYRLRRALH